jgi:3-oxoacyl-[acyl-carrier-protein] synthase-3
MKHIFKNKRISAVVSVLPSNEVHFKDEIGNYAFSANQNLRLAKIMGFNKRRLSKLNETISDYAVVGIAKLIEQEVFRPEDIGAILVVTTTPDHVLPPVSSIIQGKFNFSQETICMDITQGCPGYIVGMLQALLILDILGDKKVLLVNGDFLTHKISTRDRGSRPIAGDAVAITVVENTKDDNEIYLSLKNDGANAFAVYIPAGGTRLPYSDETSIEKVDDYGNYRSDNQLLMNGDLVFNFILNEAPTMMEELLEYSNLTKVDIDYYMCHQSSRFTLEKLADRLEIPREKMPNNVIENFGNSSSASIPVAITYNLSTILTSSASSKIMLTGFGIGLTWGGIIMDMGNMKYCGMIDYKHN